MAGGGFYAVAHGREVGVFSSWAEAEARVKGFKGAVFKKFPSLTDARAFVAAKGSSTSSSSTSYANHSNNTISSRKHARSWEASPAATAADQPTAKRALLQQQQQQQAFYAVAKGHSTGVVTSWPQVLALTDGYVGPVFRKFATREAAEAFVAGYVSRERQENRGGLPVTSSVIGDASAPEASLKTYRIGYGAQVDTEAPGAERHDEQQADNTTAERTAAAAAPTQLWYAVAGGRQTGVFASWNEAKQHVKGRFSASIKKFSSREEAEAFVRQDQQRTGASASDPDPEHPETLVAFCDGSALQNGQRGCQAGFACVFPHCPAWNVARKLTEHRATNNRAEYFAALEALKRANAEDATQRRVLFIFSDSMLLIRSMTEWIGAWRRNNWCKANGAPVLNRDILEQLVAAQGERRVLWRHVKAHTGKTDWRSKWNDVADRAARNAAGES